MQLQHPELIDLLKKAYSAEKAASFAYQGHAASVKNPIEKAAIRQIELDEWNHGKEVLQLMDLYGIQPSKYYECRFHIVGKIISWGGAHSFNNIDLDKKYPMEESGEYCKK